MKGFKGHLPLLLASMVLIAVSGEALAQVPADNAIITRVDDGEREIKIESHKARFVVQEDWAVQEQEGIYIITSKDASMLLVVVSLGATSEIPEAMKQLDAMVPVTGAHFGKPTHGGHQGMPVEILAGQGKLQPSGKDVELLTLTMNARGKPVLAVFFVHKDKFEGHLPKVKRTLESCALLVSQKEIDAIQKKAAEKPDPK